MSDIELQPAQPVSSADTPIGNIAHKCVDTPELSALYDENRQWLFDRYQEFFASPDYIPVLRVAEIDDGKTKIRQDRIGSQMFSNMLAHSFQGNKYYQCLTCRQAFMAAFPIWFMNRNGAVVSPMVELQEKLQFFPVDLRHTTDAKVQIKWVPVPHMNERMAQASKGDWSHYHILTAEQMQAFNNMPSADLANAKALALTVANINAGLDPKLIYDAIKSATNSETGLSGLKHLAEFSNALGVIGDVNIRTLFIAHLLRKPEWSALSHFNGSTAGTVFEMFALGSDTEAVITRYLEMTDPANFKQRRSEVTANLFVQMRDKLKELNALGILVRRPAIVGKDAYSCWTSKKTLPADEEVEVIQMEVPEDCGDEALNAIERLVSVAKNNAAVESIIAAKTAKRLQEEKKPFENVASTNSAIARRPTPISLDGFMKMVKENQPRRIALKNTMGGASVLVVCTTEVQETPGLWNALKEGEAQVSMQENCSIIGISTTKALPRSHIVMDTGLVEHEQYFELSAMASFGKINVMIPFGSEHLAYLMFPEGQQVPTILGGEIRNDIYGMSGAIRTASAEVGVKHAPKGTQLNDTVAGFIFTIGDVFAVEMADGNIEQYQVVTAH